VIDVTKESKRTSLPIIVVFVIIVGMIALSFYYLYGGLLAYLEGETEEAFYYAILGSIGVGVAIYMTYMIRKRKISKKPPPKVVTTIECKKCGFKSLNKFKKGEYIFRTVDLCQKCNEPMLITAIYAETEKK